MQIGIRTVHQLALSATIITVLFLGGILHPHAAAAATYYVATTGNNANPGTQAQPFQTIRQGLRILRAGDTLYLRGGTYREKIDSNIQAIPGGTSWDNATLIASYPTETATLLPDVDDGGAINLPKATDHYIIFDRLVLDGNQTSSAISVGSSGAHHIRFQNSDIKNARGIIKNGTYAGGPNIHMMGSFNEVINSKIHGSQHSYGFYIDRGHDNLVEGNDIYDNAGYAVQIFSGYYPTASTDNHIIRNNKMYNNGFSRKQGAMTVGKGSNCRVYNNLIYSNFGGIAVYNDGTNEQIYNNTLYKNGWGIQIHASSRGAIIKNNILYQNRSAIDDRGVGTIQSNNLTTDPKFVNASANNFMLQSTSPAINTGVALSAVPKDLNKLSRPQGVSYDIGAYEYQVFHIPVPKNIKVISITP